MQNIEHLTHKTGKFVFSGDIETAAFAHYIIEANTLYRTVFDLPILPDLAEELEIEAVRRSIHGTAAIEGNKLTEEEVGVLISTAPSGESFTSHEYEIINLQEAYKNITGKVTNPEPVILTEDFIKSIHKTLTKGLNYYHNTPGGYRNEPVKAGDKAHGGIYTPPKTLDDVRNLMRIFIQWINSEEMLNKNSFLRAALAHYYLAKIHPFQDGNGRTARFVEAYILYKAGIKHIPKMLSHYYSKHLDEYFVAFSASQKQSPTDLAPFIEFYFTGVMSCLNDVKNKIFLYIRILSLSKVFQNLKESKALKKREFDLLNLLMSNPMQFTKGDLFSSPVLKHIYGSVSDSTAQRNLKKLVEMRCLILNPDTKKYELNLHMLD